MYLYLRFNLCFCLQAITFWFNLQIQIYYNVGLLLPVSDGGYKFLHIYIYILFHGKFNLGITYKFKSLNFKNNYKLCFINIIHKKMHWITCLPTNKKVAIVIIREHLEARSIVLYSRNDKLKRTVLSKLVKSVSN